MTNCTCCQPGCIERCPSLSIAEWGALLCINPYYLHQQAQMDTIRGYENTPIPLYNDAKCQNLVYNCGSGCPSAGRDDIWGALQFADEAFRDYSHYFPSPTPDCEEIYWHRGWRGGRVKLRNAKLNKLGKQTLTFVKTVSLDPTTQITDSDGDGIVDTVTVSIYKTLLPGLTNPDEFAVFFQQPDWGGSPGSPTGDRCRHEIRPITVKTELNKWVITFPSYVFIRPKILVGFNQEAHDPNNLTIYPIKIDIYRRWVDESQAITIFRKPEVCGCSCGRSSECYTCEPATACIISHEESIIDINLRDGCCCPKCADRICVNYVSGECLDPILRKLLAQYAAALLGRGLCCCEQFNKEVAYWQQSFVAVSDRGRTITTLSAQEKANPFGVNRGAVELYRYLRRSGKRKMEFAII